MQPRHSRSPLRRGLIAAATVAVSAASVLGTASLAGAADSNSGSGGGTGAHAHPQLTDTQKRCLSDALSAAGITLPQKPADGTRPQLTQEQSDSMKAAMKAAAEQCGLPARAPRGDQAGQPGQPGQNV